MRRKKISVAKKAFWALKNAQKFFPIVFGLPAKINILSYVLSQQTKISIPVKQRYFELGYISIRIKQMFCI
jgi:hypothetical protein